MKRIVIDPVTRLEGHGRIEILLDASGNVANAFFTVPELRGFEHFCVGRHAEEMPILTSRICGVCPEAHLTASAKALDDLFDAPPPEAAVVIRELFYMAFFAADHLTNAFALSGPDLLVGPDAPVADRNIAGVVRKFGRPVGDAFVAARAGCQSVIRRLGGRGINPVAAIPGGWSRRVTEGDREAVRDVARKTIDFAAFTLDLFGREVFAKDWFKAMSNDGIYLHRTHSMGTVAIDGALALYDGKIRVVDPEGAEIARYAPADYARHISERTEAWSYMKAPYLSKVGWNGYVDGADSGVYFASPLSRLNVADKIATPSAHAEFERFFAEEGSGKTADGRQRPVHSRMATHRARLIEVLYAAERMAELAEHPLLTSPDFRTLPRGCKGVGIGSVEAPRGTLTHHYEADARGVITKANLVVGTTNNHAAIAMSIRRAAEEVLRGGAVDDDAARNRIEMAFRAYDPCLSCATHADGRLDLPILVRDADGRVVRELG